MVKGAPNLNIKCGPKSPLEQECILKNEQWPLCPFFIVGSALVTPGQWVTITSRCLCPHCVPGDASLKAGDYKIDN